LPRWMRQGAFLAGFFWLMFAGAQSLTPEDVRTPEGSNEVSVTLEEALERAARLSPDLVRALGAVQTAQASRRTAFGAFLPSVSVNASASLTSSQRFIQDASAAVVGSNGSYTAGISSSWDVFTGLRRGAEWDRTAAETRSAQAQLEAQRFVLALSVQQAFYDALRADELRQVALSRIGRAGQAVTAANQRLAAGDGTRSDWLRAKLEANTARESELRALTQGVAARYELGRLMGVQGPARPLPVQSFRQIPLDGADEQRVEAIVTGAPSVKAARATAEVSDAGVRVARAQYFPSARLTAGYDWFNPQLYPIDGRTSWSVRLGLTFPLFDGFKREEAVTRARVSLINSQATLTDTERAARSAAASALSQLRLQQDRIGLAEEAVDVAKEDVRVQQERYRLGVTTMLELLTSQANLVQAENDLVGARFDYQLARAQLESVAGRSL